MPPAAVENSAELTVEPQNLSAVLAFTTSGKRMAAGTVTVPTGGSGTAFTTGLTTVEYVLATPYSTVETVAGFAGVAAQQGGGTVTLRGISSAGTASTASGTATWLAVGT